MLIFVRLIYLKMVSYKCKRLQIIFTFNCLLLGKVQVYMGEIGVSLAVAVCFIFFKILFTA